MGETCSTHHLTCCAVFVSAFSHLAHLGRWHSLNTQFMADGGIYEFRFFRDDKSYKAAVSSLVFVPTEVCAPYNTSCPKSGKAPKLSNGNITDYLKSEQPVFGDDWVSCWNLSSCVGGCSCHTEHQLVENMYTVIST